jgi:pyruvate,water dikinase
MWQENKVPMFQRHPGLRAVWLQALLAGLVTVLLPSAARSGDFCSVDPLNIYAGTFYDGATLRVRGSIADHSHVAIRVTGPLEHHTFNRRGKIGGVIWGGIEHVTFHNAPSLFKVCSSAALAATADRAARVQLRLGYEWLEERVAVEGTWIDKQSMIAQFVRLKEKEGLYSLAPGAIRLLDTENGRRGFEAEVSLPATAPAGAIEVAVFEIADGSVIGEKIANVKLEHVGMPAFLYRLAHEQGTLFGILAVLVLMTTGLVVDLAGSWKTTRQRHPAIVALAGLARGVGDVLLSPHGGPRNSADVDRLHEKYQIFRRFLILNNEMLELLAEVEEESSWTSFRHPRMRMGIRALFDGTADMVDVLNELTENRYFDLANVIAGVRTDVSSYLEKVPELEDPRLTLQLSEVDSKTAGKVGGKAVNLARIECDLGLRVPQSFIVTTEAYREFLEVEGLASKLRAVLAPARLDTPDDFRRRCELAQGLVEQACVPPAVEEAIQAAHRSSGIPQDEGLAVRSSASGEDSELSFAGQFETVLNVPASALADAWKKVVLSRFAPRAVFYRRAAGLAEVDTPMAVLIQRMVCARASGVLFTRRPDDPRSSVLLITAVRGLGPDASAGVANADEFVLSHSQPHRILDRRIARKPARLVGADGGGLAQLKVAVEEQLQPSIAEEESIQLAKAGLAIEHYFGKAQDIEWAIDMDGRVFILQTRPLRTEKTQGETGAIPRDAPLLLRGGEPVWIGRAVGPVHIARSPQEQDATPTGAVLVVPQLLPDCVRLIPRVCGIITERGTVTGHAASLVREFRMPCLFGVTGVLDTLVPGTMVSLDVASRSVFAGVLWPELRGHLPVALLGHRSAGLPDVLADKLTKLSGSSFMGTWACQSLHDVIRYAHEMAIQSMFDIGDQLLGSSVGGVKKLDCPPQFYMHIVDLGGGIRPGAASRRTVKPEDIVSVPFRGLWRGLGDLLFEPPHSESPPHSFGSVLATTMAAGGARELGSPNYACITDNYLNLNSRQAYHFAIVDSYLCENQNNNHISMRLKGGGAASWQRELRAHFVAKVLKLNQFAVNVTGDLCNGWIRGLDRDSGGDKLAMIGHLLRFLARLDVWMSDNSDVKTYTDAFVEAESAAQAARGADSGIAPA